MQNRKNIIKENNSQIETLENYINDKIDELRNLRNNMAVLENERLTYLRSWYSNRLDKDSSLKRILNDISSYLPDYAYTIESIKKLLHRQTLNNTTYRNERKLYNHICNYINNNSFEYVTPNDVAVLVAKYKTQNGKTLIKKLDLERKLQIRKQHLTDLLVNNRGTRLWERENLTEYDRAYCWYTDKVAKFVDTTVQKFRTSLKDKGINSYDVMFNCCGDDLKKWYTAITKEHTMTLGQLNAIAYKEIKGRYNQAINGYNNTIKKDIKEKALQKHELATMTLKERKKLQFEKWSKVKNTLNMFSGAIEIDKKIDFNNYKPVATSGVEAYS